MKTLQKKVDEATTNLGITVPPVRLPAANPEDPDVDTQPVDFLAQAQRKAYSRVEDLKGQLHEERKKTERALPRR